MEQILEMITNYGLETVVIALLVNLLTGFSKMPIKAWASKLNDSTKVTRYIVFLPIIFGFLLSFLYANYIKGVFNFDREFITMWLTASSLSLTFYAIFEKLFPSKKKILNDCEIKTSEKILDNITQLVERVAMKETSVVDNTDNAIGDIEEPTEEIKDNKIVLRGNINAGAKTKR